MAGRVQQLATSGCEQGTRNFYRVLRRRELKIYRLGLDERKKVGGGLQVS